MKPIYQTYVIIILSLTLFLRCSKHPICESCDGKLKTITDELILEYPSVTTPGYFTLVRAVLNGSLTYPIVVKWYANASPWSLDLKQIDTVTYGNKDWYTFNFPQLFKASPYSKGPYVVRCEVIKPDRDGPIEKTIYIKSDL